MRRPDREDPFREARAPGRAGRRRRRSPSAAAGPCLPARPRSSTGTTITRSDVNELAEAQCAGIEQAAKSRSGAGQETPRKQLVQQALSLLMDIELSLQYGESRGRRARGPSRSPRRYAQIDPLHQDPAGEVPRRSCRRRSSAGPRHATCSPRSACRRPASRPTPTTPRTLLNAGYAGARALAEDGRHRHRPPLRTRRRRLARRGRPVGVQGRLVLRQGRRQGPARPRLGERAAGQPEVRLTP